MSLRRQRQSALQRQVARVDGRLQLLKTLSNRFSWYRLLIVAAGLALGLVAAIFVNDWLGWSVIAATLLVFNIVAYFHRRIDRSIRRHQIWREIKSTQIARMNLNWGAIPEPQHHEADLSHPFEIDLDITGKPSLHQLVDTSISRAGHDRLRTWFLETRPSDAVILERQAVVKELAPLARFRDKLLLAYYHVSKRQLESKVLLEWVRQATQPPSLYRVLIASSVLAVLNVLLFGLHELDVIPGFWKATFALYVITYLMNFNLTGSLLDDSNMISDELRKFREILIYLENYRYGSHPNLRKLCQAFAAPTHRPSTRLRQISWLGFAIGLRMNFAMRVLLNGVVPWDFFLVHRTNKMKVVLSDDLPVWLDVLTELEALVSLANFSYLNPEYSFPKISAATEAKHPVFEAKDLGHPLIPANEKVCNDFAFRQSGEIVLITGSNMSGKSTFLKTIGINLCLAFAGGPVNAASLTTSLFRLYSCIKINDSVTGGFSFFYAEVKRLKGLLQQLETDEARPLLFLIDEIFKGTNNRERLIGSRSYIEALAGRNGLGIVSTHDLELTSLSERIPELVNCHFREDVQNGHMVFDFKLREGPCPTTNALKIMRMEGLPVTEETR